MGCLKPVSASDLSLSLSRAMCEMVFFAETNSEYMKETARKNIVSHHLVLGGCAPICKTVCVQLGPLTSVQQCLGGTSGCEETPGRNLEVTRSSD